MTITPEQARVLAAHVLDDSALAACASPIWEGGESRPNPDSRAGPAAGPRAGPVSAPDAPPASPPARPPVMERIAGYRITRVLASGGMGEVYEAEQDRPRRTVAIKVMKRGLTSRTALRRFEWEAELLGSLRHPGIATVFEAGSWDDGSGGVPYFVMEFIPGAMPITRYARQRGLDVRARLELFARVCDAVQHGHQKGIIHRDLKPGNILVGEEESHKPCAMCHEGRNEGGPSPLSLEGEGQGEGDPLSLKGEGKGEGRASGGSRLFDAAGANSGSPIVKIIDFGIARATDSDIAVTTMHTEVGQLIGTLQYMSPEQCEGDPRNVDTRSDVYSLGVVLYELICGRLPYDVSDTSIPRATRMIQETEPIRPSTIQRKLRGDLETIALKALEKDRARRYQSAGDLADDVRRHLRGEAIEARRAGRWERGVRWVGRHPVVTTGVACGLLAITILGSSFLTANYLRQAPSHFVVASDKSIARLLSVGGHVLAEFGGRGGSVRVAKLAKLSDGLRVLVSVSAGQNNTGGQLRVYRWPNLQTPDWTTSFGPPFISMPDLYFEASPAAPPQTFENTYVAAHALVEDVFGDDGVPEIIVHHEHACCSPTAIRVYDFSGKVLFDAWHWGTITDIYWLAEEHVIAALGYRHNRQEVEPYGWPNAGEHVWPRVVMGLRPRIGVDTGWLNRYEDPPIAAALAWYGYLRPRSLVDGANLTLAAPTDSQYDPRKYFCVLIDHPDLGGLSLTILIRPLFI